MINQATLNQVNLLTTNQLIKQIKSAISFEEEHPEFKQGWHNEYIQHMKMVLANRIGKK